MRRFRGVFKDENIAFKRENFTAILKRQKVGSYERSPPIMRVLRAPGQIDRNGTRKSARYRSADYVYENIPPEIKAAAYKREYQKRQNGGR